MVGDDIGRHEAHEGEFTDGNHGRGRAKHAGAAGIATRRRRA